MALDPSARYPGQIDTASDPTGYPHGKAKNILSPGDGTGTPWEQDLVNDIFGFQQALLDAASVAPSGTPDKVGASDYLDSLDTFIDQEFVKSRSKMVPLLSGKGAAGWTAPIGPTGGIWTSPFPADQSYVVFDLNDFLPNGCTITAVWASVNPEAGRASGSRMELTAFREQLNWATDGSVSGSTVLGTVEDDGGSSQQILKLTGLSQAVDLTREMFTASVRCGAGGGSAGDLVRGVVVFFDQVSPRKAA